MEYKIEKMNYELAKCIISWNYPKPYDLYIMEDSMESLNELLSGPYYSVRVENQLIGFWFS